MSLSVRLEADPRNTDPREGATVPLADPAWMLARQWWVGEMRGFDGGAPVVVDFRTRTDRLVGPDGTAAALAPSTSLAVPPPEDNDAPGDWRQALRIGRRIAAAIDQAIDRFQHRDLPRRELEELTRFWRERRDDLPRRFPLKGEHPALRRVAASERIDGQTLLRQFDRAPGDLRPFEEPIEAIRTTLPRPGSFDIATGENSGVLQTARGAAIPVIGAPGPRLHLSDVEMSDLDPGAVDPADHRAVPSRLGFAGSPPQRWWSLQEGALHWAASPAGPSDLGQLVIAAGMAAQNRPLWSIAFEVPCNSFFRVEQVTVRDGFGSATQARSMRNDIAGAWRHGGPDAPMLVLTEGPHLAGDPLEEVLMRADEGDNLVWMVELRAQGADGWPRILSGTRIPRDVSTSSYALRLPPPDNWLAYLTDGSGNLLRRPLSTASGRREVATRLAVDKIAAGPEMIGNAGRGFVAEWRLARSASGHRHLWLARRETGPATIGGSGLAHDRILRPEA